MKGLCQFQDCKVAWKWLGAAQNAIAARAVCANKSVVLSRQGHVGTPDVCEEHTALHSVGVRRPMVAG